MRTIASHGWGGDNETLLHLYRALIRSRIEYGSLAYDTASDTTLTTINRIQNEALRIALGAYRTSPISSLHCLAGELPPDLRRKQQALCYHDAVLCNDSHINYKRFVAFRGNNVFNGKSDKQVPFWEIIRRLKTEFNVEKVSPCNNITLSQNIAPWNPCQVNTDTTLSAHNKANNPPIIIQQQFKELLSTYDVNSVIYTDASKIEYNVGAALKMSNEEQTFKLHHLNSIFTAELYALYNAVQLTARHPDDSFAICFDSLSSLLSLNQIYSKNILVQEIRTSTSKGSNIVFIYVPSHSGVTGNEAVDLLAKAAALCITPKIGFLTITDIKRYYRSIVTAKWNEAWRNENRFLKNIKPTLDCNLSSPSGRKEEIVKNRLRIGHTKLTHSYILENHNPPQ